eukprot:gene1116-3808_t
MSQVSDRTPHGPEGVRGWHDRPVRRRESGLGARGHPSGGWVAFGHSIGA